MKVHVRRPMLDKVDADIVYIVDVITDEGKWGYRFFLTQEECIPMHSALSTEKLMQNICNKLIVAFIELQRKAETNR